MKAELRVCAKYGIRPSRSAWREFHGMTAVAIFEELIKRFGQGKDGLDVQKMFEEKMEYYSELSEEEGLPIIPGSINFIKEKVKKYFEKVALVTSSGKFIQSMTFDEYELWPHFDAIVTGNDVKQSKPYPDPYLLASEKLGLSPQECFVLEDSDNGIRSAVAAGCTTIGITSNFPSEYLISVGAKTTIDSYDELEERLRSGELIK